MNNQKSENKAQLDANVMPKTLQDVAIWHKQKADEQMEVAEQFRKNKLNSLYEEWKNSSLAHEKCRKLIMSA